MIYNFHDVNWGEDEAKGDPDLIRYFLKIPDYDKIIEGKKRYILGRKGTGKTAILEKIRLDAKENDEYSYKDLSLKDFPLNDIRGLRDRSMQDKSQFVPAWTFLIIIELCKLIVKDITAENYVIKEQISDFLKVNKLDLDGGFVETVKTLTSKESKVSLSASIFGGEKTSGQEFEFEVPIHYTKSIQPLKEILKKITSQTKYFILFDELDEGYYSNDTNKRLLLLSLFRAIENLAIEFRSYNFPFRPVLTLRTDIFDNLADNDLNKIDDFIIRLNWQADSNYNYSIKQLVNVRIYSSLQIQHEDLWSLICDDADRNVPGPKKSIWRYLYTRTFERPRDIIKFLKYCQTTCPHGRLKFPNVSDAENQYANWFYREIRDEIQSHLPVWKEAINGLSKIGKGTLDTEEFKKVLEKDKEVQKYLENNNKDTEDLMEMLFDFSIIGNLDENGRWLFKYKDHDLSWNSSKRIAVHFGLNRKLRLSNR